MSEVVLYDYWRSSASYRVRIALGLKGLNWTPVPMDLLARDQRTDAFKQINPQALVPVLKIDGLTLTQSLAIIDYLDETRPEPALLPNDAADRARVRALAHIIAMDVHPVNMFTVLEHVGDMVGGGQQAALDWMQRFMPPGLAAFERLLDDPATGRFCHGDAPGLADICLVPQAYNATRWGIDMTAYPRISAVVAACDDLPAFMAAQPDQHKPAPNA